MCPSIIKIRRVCNMVKVSRLTKIAYGIGQMSQGVKDVAFQSFVVFYFSQVLGMPAIWASVAALLALVVDAISDPLVGDISDNWQSKRWGRRHPFMIAALIPFPVAMYFLFSPPEGLSHEGLFCWLLICSIAVRTALTFFNVPHNALGAELSKCYEERTRIVSYRTLLGYIGGIMLSVIALNAFFKVSPQNPDGMLNAAAYADLGLLAAIIAFVAMAVCILGTKSVISQLPLPKDTTKKVDLRRSIMSFSGAFALKPFRLIFFVQVLTMIAGGAGATFMLYLGSYFFALSPEQISLLTLTIIVGLVPASILAPWMAKRFDKMPALVGSIVVASIFSFSPIILRLTGLLVDNADPLLMPILFLTYVGGYCFFIAAGIVIGSMLADIADLQESKSGKRQEGIFFAANSFAQKATFGFGTLLAGVCLEVIAFPKQAVVADVSQDAIYSLGLVAGPVPLMIYLFAALLATRYGLNRAEHKKIQANIPTQ